MGVTYEDDQVVVCQGDASRWAHRLGPYTHVITDVPYDERTRAGARSSSGRDLAPWSWSEAKVRRLWARLAPLTSRWLVSTMAYQQAMALERKPPEGIRPVRIGVWVKTGGAPQLSGDRPAQGWEAVSICHVDRGRMRWNGGGQPAVWEHRVDRSRENPNAKPLNLVLSWVHAFSDPGDVILDPWAGSGVVGVAALQAGRRAVLIERGDCDPILRNLERRRNRLRQLSLIR